MADDDRRLEWNNEVGRNTDERGREQGEPSVQGHRKGTGVAREGEDNPEQDLGDRGDSEVTGEGEDTPELGLGDRADIEATREGEDNPELDLVDRGNVEATREGKGGEASLRPLDF